jgi:site-specific DNA-methyltransferase (adenine-specific)
MIELLNVDCMEYMKGLPDKAFDLAICDPEYGINVGKMSYLTETKTTVRQKNGTRLNPNKRSYKIKDWDNKPAAKEYFNELFRVSKNQIIFGIDYFDWKPYCKGRIKWDKGVPDGVSFKRYETAYCSLIDEEIDLPLLWAGMMQAKSLLEPMVQQGNKKLNEKRIHPCQKPVLLYKKLLYDYAKPGDKILDTHGGSRSLAISCYKMGFDHVSCEIDLDYHNDSVKRVHDAMKQQKLFDYA